MIIQFIAMLKLKTKKKVSAIVFRAAIRAAFVVILGFTTLAEKAAADSISVSPTNLAVPRGSQQTVLTVRAQGSAQSVIQVRAFRWDPSRPPSEFHEQTRVVVSPPISRLNARQELTVRIVRVDSAPVQEKECYRILVDRLPDSSENAQTITLRIRHSVPLCFTA